MRVHVSTGYHHDEGNRRASRNGLVSDLPPETIRHLFVASPYVRRAGAQAVRKYCKKKPDVICIAHESTLSIAEAGQLSTGRPDMHSKPRRTITTASERQRRKEEKSQGTGPAQVMQSDADWAKLGKERRAADQAEP